MVEAGGSLRAVDDKNNQARATTARHSAIFMVLAVGLLAFAALSAVEEEGAAVELQQKSGAFRDLHFANSLKPEASGSRKASGSSRFAASSSEVVTGSHEQTLASAKMAAEKRLSKSKIPAEVLKEDREELQLRKELDNDVKQKQEHAFSLANKDLKTLRDEEKEAAEAKREKIKVTDAASSPDGDASEELALRKRLDEEAKEREEAMLRKAEPFLRKIKGIHDGTAKYAGHIAKSSQISESQLEAQLRDELNKKAKTEQEGMYKKSINSFLSSSPGMRGRDLGRSENDKDSSDDLKEAEMIMKRELELTKPQSKDMTLLHKSLHHKVKVEQQKKVHGIDMLEKAMLQSNLKRAKLDEPKLQHKQEMLRKLREAAKAKLSSPSSSPSSKKPSYQDAMLTFSKRLMNKERNAQQKFDSTSEVLKKKFAKTTKDQLEEAIKHKVQLKLTKGTKALAQERAELARQFEGSHSLFAKTEEKELRQLESKQAAKEATLSGPVHVKDHWHL